MRKRTTIPSKCRSQSTNVSTIPTMVFEFSNISTIYIHTTFYQFKTPLLLDISLYFTIYFLYPRSQYYMYVKEFAFENLFLYVYIICLIKEFTFENNNLTNYCLHGYYLQFVTKMNFISCYLNSIYLDVISRKCFIAEVTIYGLHQDLWLSESDLEAVF